MPFTGNHSVCFVQGRRGEVYVYQGYGNRGQVWSPSTQQWRNVGLDAPAAAPTISPSVDGSNAPTVRYYIARIDITDGGSGYANPPSIQIDAPPGLTCTGPVENPGAPVFYSTVLHPTSNPGQQTSLQGQCATAISRTQDGSLSSIEVIDYGKGYTTSPTVVIPAPAASVSGATVVTPADLTTNVNNYAPAAGDIYNLTSTVDVTITGWSAPGANRTIVLRNVGEKVITLANLSASSSAPNRIAAPFPNNSVIGPGRQVTLTYGSPAGRWNAGLVEASGVDNSEGPRQATAAAIVRAHLRGKYRCYVRYVNDAVPVDEGGPICSNLSPVREVNVGDGREYIDWSGAGINTNPPTGLSVELWRTTSNQATTLFRVAKRRANYNSATDTWSYSWEFGSARDSLTDWELIDPNRTGFQAMPILLPTGELNANRFGIPPSDYCCAVMFQDRLWMAGDTSGAPLTNANALRFSEMDEPESMPDVNELLLQSNVRSTDYITALAPFAGHLVVGQTRHCYRLTYNAQPIMDASVSLLAYRGIYNQRCWDIANGMLYAMDDAGVYSMSPQGEIEDLSMGIFDLWVDKIDSALSKWFTLRVDRRLGLIRICVAVIGDGSIKYPTRQYCYSLDYKAWWEERYPAELTAATECDTVNGGVALVYGTSGGKLRQLSNGLQDIGEGAITAVTITNPGRGYKTPPTITAPGGHGAVFECGIDIDGRITGVLIKCPGTKYTAGNLTISAPPAGGTQAQATFSVTNGPCPVFWSMKSGAFEYTTDTQDKRGGEVQNRQCSVTYQPTNGPTTLNLKTYYNNARYPRSNVVRRDRGTGFVHSDVVPAATLDMQATPLQEAESHGVARAVFSGRALDDMMGTDRHVSVALSGRQDSSGPVVIHTLDIYGVNDKQGG